MRRKIERKGREIEKDKKSKERKGKWKRGERERG